MNGFNEKIKRVLSFVAPFFQQYLSKNDSKGIHELLKAIAYGQGGISFGFILSNLASPDLVMFGLILICPIFLSLGLGLSLLAINSSEDGYLLSVVLFCLLIATVIHLICLFFLLLSGSFWLSLALVIGVWLSMWLLSYVLVTYYEIKPKSESMTVKANGE
ncbi:hypothetical protein Q8A57_02410 [Porticoccus litoralis]|uniref:DUF3021 domain-containing protein n=1 Tax=Porticoccus litoralis TaxID=434086 RepID=A0AAW8B2Q9_9GAMM|nr:hypothetical protein [Porticoccus litoralis]MDP1519814.1 hypothetical protein [Porticoccus litoralis]